ncbi:MAG: AAA family ATPase [Chloroflexota bacterium]
MPIITVSRQVGSLGDEIASGVATRLGLRLVDQDIINQVAERLGVSPSSLTRHDEREATLVSELVRTMRRLYPATLATNDSENADVDEAAYAQVIRQVIWEVARGGDAVIVGRAASLILGQHPDTVHVLVVAPRDVRIERVMTEGGLDRSKASRRVAESDANRARYIRHFYRANWLDVNLYDLVVNTGHFSELRAVSLVCSAAARDEISTGGDPAPQEPGGTDGALT